jgi:hypothetical protein
MLTLMQRHAWFAAHTLRMCVWLLLCACVGGAQAADAVPAYQVFWQRAQGQLVLIALDTGESRSVPAVGERFTVLGDGILSYDPSRAQVLWTTPDGQTRPHPFIQQMDSTARRIDWAVAADRTAIAWTVTRGDDARLTTQTYSARADGSELRLVFEETRDDGLRALPVSFSADGAQLYMDYQPDGISAFTLFAQYAGLFALDIGVAPTDPDGVDLLVGEPGCFCGGAVRDGLLLRLALSPDLSGFDVRMVNLLADETITVPSLALRNYTQAGDMIFSPDGRYAVYALARVEAINGATEIRTVIALVDVVNRAQRAMSDPILDYVRPVAWTEDNAAVILTSPQRDGTWKLPRGDNEAQRIVKIGDATYLGLLNAP